MFKGQIWGFFWTLFGPRARIYLFFCRKCSFLSHLWFSGSTSVADNSPASQAVSRESCVRFLADLQVQIIIIIIFSDVESSQ